MDFQYENTERKYKALLEKELEKQEVQEGLMAACDCIDATVSVWLFVIIYIERRALCVPWCS